MNVCLIYNEKWTRWTIILKPGPPSLNIRPNKQPGLTADSHKDNVKGGFLKLVCHWSWCVKSSTKGSVHTTVEACCCKVILKSINVYDRDKRHQLLKDIRVLSHGKINKGENSHQCPFLVELYGGFYMEGCVKVVLEYMDIGSLRDIINKQRKLSEAVLAVIIMQILNGLMYLHFVMNEMHRDIKPENILINSKGEVKLTDFGLSKQLVGIKDLGTTFVGTVTYMSPERLEHKKHSFESDIWSLGLVLIELCTGQYAYGDIHKSPLEVIRTIIDAPSPQLPNKEAYSSELSDFLQNCLQKDPSKRQNSIQLMAHPWIIQNCRKSVDIEKWAQNYN